MEQPDTFKYHFKIGNFIVHGGITKDLVKEETALLYSGKCTVMNGLRLYWKYGYITQIDSPLTWDDALVWVKENGWG